MIKFIEKDPYAPIQYSYEVSRILYHKRSKFQDIMVFENPFFGKVLVLDGVVQITEKDEFFYHEMLAHIVLNSHPDPKKVIVIGGGDGGTVREVLKHKSVEKVLFHRDRRRGHQCLQKILPLCRKRSQRQACRDQMHGRRRVCQGTALRYRRRNRRFH